MNETADVVFVGAGHNALISAARLAEAGYRVLVLERADQVGGALRSAEITEPHFISDLFATNLNLLLPNPGFNRWKGKLEDYGLRLAWSPAPYANVFPDGTSLCVFHDANKTEASMAARDPRDLAGWKELHNSFKDFSETLLPFYGPPMPSLMNIRLITRALHRAGRKKVLALARIITATTRELGDAYFCTPEAKALIATWGLHLDFGPDVSFGAMFPFIESFSDMENGISIAEGGASSVSEALASLVRSFGGDVRTESEVVRIVTTGGKAAGVALASGEVIRARKAVVAGVGPNALFNGLLRDDPAVSEQLRVRARRYQYGPGTMMIHLSLDGPVPWNASEDLRQFAYVHIAPYVDDLAKTYQQAQAGVLPDSPLLIVGQSSVVDPTRSPDGKQVLWIQVRALPSSPKSDSLGQIPAKSWDQIKEAYADRVMDIMEEYASGFKSLIRNRVTLSPADLERMNPNLVGGDSISGSHHFWQNFAFRPWDGSSRYAMPLPRLFMTGAATWPGGGLNGMSGWNAAGEILRRSKMRFRFWSACTWPVAACWRWLTKDLR